MKQAFFLIIAALLMAAPLLRGEELVPVLVKTPPKIDGDLSDQAWQGLGRELTFVGYTPSLGSPFPRKTTVYAAYDQKNLYFAFLCEDPDPGQLKGGIAPRDKVNDHDYIMVMIDSQNLQQSGFAFVVNPNGVQGDGIMDNDGNVDRDPDFVWTSGGRITEKGYQVEIALPLRTIRFKRGKEVSMNIGFARRDVRLGITATWPILATGAGVTTRLHPMTFKDLPSPMTAEILPSFTSSSNRVRESQERWGSRDAHNDVGINMKATFHSSITAEVTINPDFSQVESDSYQVEVNQRFPLFYGEKRPFFMEGMGVFELAASGNGDFLFYTPLNTRNIVAPLWGAKVTGTQGQHQFGLLLSEDDLKGRDDPSGSDKALFTVLRDRRSLGGDNYVGFLYSGREAGDDYNRVAGVDFSLRTFKDQQFSFYVMANGTKSGEESVKKGIASAVRYLHSSRRLYFDLLWEHFDTDFNMESAYLTRNGVDKFQFGFVPQFFPKNLLSLQRYDTIIFGQTVRDHRTGLDDQVFVIGHRFTLPHSVTLRGDFMAFQEGWIDKEYLFNKGRFQASCQPTKWLTLSGRFEFGGQLFYSETDPFKGHGTSYSLDAELQPTGSLSLESGFSRERLNREESEVYTVDLFDGRLTYNINKHLFLRTTVRYNSYRKEWLKDLLLSFTYIPGTVVHFGYGALDVKQRWDEDHWTHRIGDYMKAKESLFFKVSYLWRI